MKNGIKFCIGALLGVVTLIATMLFCALMEITTVLQVFIVIGVLSVIAIGVCRFLEHVLIDSHKLKTESSAGSPEKLMGDCKEKKELENSKRKFESCLNNTIGHFPVSYSHYIPSANNTIIGLFASVKENGCSIFDIAINNYPCDNNDIRKFITHYIPMIMGMISNYKNIFLSPDCDERTESLESINNSLNLFCQGASVILNDIKKVEILNTTVNAQVLSTILERDGLVYSDFKSTLGQIDKPVTLELSTENPLDNIRERYNKGNMNPLSPIPDEKTNSKYTIEEFLLDSIEDETNKEMLKFMMMGNNNKDIIPLLMMSMMDDNKKSSSCGSAHSVPNNKKRLLAERLSEYL